MIRNTIHDDIAVAKTTASSEVCILEMEQKDKIKPPLESSTQLPTAIDIQAGLSEKLHTIIIDRIQEFKPIRCTD